MELKPVIIIALAFVLLIPATAFAQYIGNVGSQGETGSYTLEEAMEIQQRRIESAEVNPSITCGVGIHLENGQCIVDTTPNPVCGSGTHLVNDQCIPKTSQAQTSSNGIWVKYDFSMGTNTNSRMYSASNFGYSLSGGSYPYGSYSGIPDTNSLKIEISEVKGSQVTLVTKAIKNDGSEEFLDQIKMNYGENILIINPNVKIGDEIEFVFPEQEDSSLGFGDTTLQVQEITSISVGDKDLNAIKSTYDKTISMSGGVSEISLTTFHEKNTGMLLILQGTFEGSSGGQYMDMNLLLNAIEVSDDLLKPKSSFGGGCLIATATYGSELAPQVQQLREIRDDTLLQTESGTNFMSGFNDVYYSFSPIIADYERENPIFREMVKVAITPMISSLSILNHVNMDSESEVLTYGISMILLNIGMYVVAPTIVIIGIKKKFYA